MGRLFDSVGQMCLHLADKHHLVHQVSLQSLPHSTTLRGVCQAPELRAPQQAQDDTCFADTYFYSITGLLRQFLGWHWLSGLPSVMNLLVNFMLMCQGKKWMCDWVQSGYPKPGSVACEARGRLGPWTCCSLGECLKEIRIWKCHFVS